MNAYGTMFVGGVVSIVLFKLVAAMMGPAVAMVLGFFFLALKIGMFVGVGFFLYRMFRRKPQEATVS